MKECGAERIDTSRKFVISVTDLERVRFSALSHKVSSMNCTIKQANGQVFYFWTVNLSWFLSTSFFQSRITDRKIKQDWKTGKRIFDRFSKRTECLGKTLFCCLTCNRARFNKTVLCLIFLFWTNFLSEIRPVKSLSSESCLDSQVRTKEQVYLPVSCRPAAEAISKRLNILYNYSLISVIFYEEFLYENNTKNTVL